jgi:hypothetical protein
MLCIAVLTFLLALSHSTDNYLIPKAVAQKDNPDRITSPTQFGQTSNQSIYASIMGPNTSAHNSTLNIGTGSPRNQTNNPESVIGSFLDPKVLLAPAIDQIRNSTATSVSSNESKTNSTAMFMRNYDTVLLARQIIPPKDFIPLFDDPPYSVIEGQVSAKLPCDSNSTSPLKIFIAKISVGQTPVLKPVQLQLVSKLSKPGYMCVYHVNLPYITSTNTTGANYGAKGNNTNTAISAAKNNLTIADIALLNPTDHVIMLPDTSSIAIGFNEIMPSAHRHPYNNSLA